MPLTIRKVKRRYEREILQIDGVVSVGIGTGSNNTPVIIVGITQENDEIMQRIPVVLEGYVVEVKIIGSINAQ
jgi:hypothetical protein